MNLSELDTLITLQDRDYPVVIRKKAIKRIIIKVNAKGGISVHCPARCSFREAFAYLQEHQHWLETVLDRQETCSRLMETEACLAFRKIWLQGTLYTIVIDPSLTVPFQFAGQTLFIREKPEKVIECLRENLEQAIRNEFTLCFKSFSGHVTQAPYLEIRKLKSRWGSCNYRTGRIVINRMLVHVPAELLHYVMIHEFTHLLYPNHGKDFHAFLKQCLPDMKKYEQDLKNYAFLLRM